MAVFRVEKSRGYTVMSNHHLCCLSACRLDFCDLGGQLPVLFNPVGCEEVIRLCRLFQIVDFRPLFIALALRRFDTVFNVNEQRHTPICLRDFCSAGTLALYPLLDCVLGVICADSL